MPVILEPPLTRSAPTELYGLSLPKEPILTAPRFVRGSRNGRWHRIRSGLTIGDDRTVFNLWCGPHIQHDMVFTDEMPTDIPVCGTCHGRAMGAGQDSWQGPGSLLFSPWRLVIPKLCPGSKKDQAYRDVSGNVVQCLFCSELVPGRGKGGPYNSRWGMQSHAPGDGLIPGCPFHAWEYIAVNEETGRVGCFCRLYQETLDMSR